MATFEVNPVNMNMLNTVTASLSDGSPLPLFISFSFLGSGNSAILQLEVCSADSTKVGDYTIMIKGSFTLLP